MDFFEDIFIGFQRELAMDGITLPIYSRTDAINNLARCAEYRMRRISQNARTVHISNHLATSNEYIQHKNAVDNLKKISESGDNISPYQSKTIDRFEYSELLLFDWGIQHLHLGQLQQGQSFADRTGPLLFAMYRDNEAYFIAIFEHGAWAETDLLNIIDSEWPQLLAPFTIKGIIGISPIPSPSETLELRKAGVTAMQQLTSGRIIAPPGGGITTAKTSTIAMMDAQRLARIIHHLEELVSKNENDIRNRIGALNGERLRLLQLNNQNQQAIIGTEEHKKFVRIVF